jgi:hypothetical protein
VIGTEAFTVAIPSAGGACFESWPIAMVDVAAITQIAAAIAVFRFIEVLPPAPDAAAFE